MQRTFVGGVDHIDLVGGDLAYRLTGLDTVPRADQPFDDRGLSDGDAKMGESHLCCRLFEVSS